MLYAVCFVYIYMPVIDRSISACRYRVESHEHIIYHRSKHIDLDREEPENDIVTDAAGTLNDGFPTTENNGRSRTDDNGPLPVLIDPTVSIEMRNFALKMRNFVSIMRNFALKMKNILLATIVFDCKACEVLILY